MTNTALAILALVASLGTPDLTCRVRSKTGQIVRSETRKRLFWRMTGYPKGRPGFVVDHLIPLACSGCDLPSNMTWLPVAEWKRKTGWERRPCEAWANGVRTRQMEKGRACEVRGLACQ